LKGLNVSKERMKDRLRNLSLVPRMAAQDHRFFLDEQGEDSRLKSLSRRERRKIAKGGRWLAGEYAKRMRQIAQSGAGYPVDQILRQFAIEYTNRYASSGLYNQPLSFNYFEPFCKIELIPDSVAPYARPVDEIDHIFSISDFFDYTTSDHSNGFELSKLFEVPEGRAAHFTVSGDVNELTFLTAEGREFVVAGFSMVRYGDYVHWFIVGGAVFSEAEWKTLSEQDVPVELDAVPPWKRLFLEQARARYGNKRGAPTPLEGTESTQRTIVTGEIDLTTGRHVGRAYMAEAENSFAIVADDPDIFDHCDASEDHTGSLAAYKTKVEEAAVLWALGEAMLQLPSYFAFKLNLERAVALAAGVSNRPANKGGKGVGARFKTITSIEVVDDIKAVVRAFSPPHYKMDTTGFWRRQKPDTQGTGPKGEKVKGRTWVRRDTKWRDDGDEGRTIYVKSTIAAAQVEVDEHLRRASEAGRRATSNGDVPGVLYVLRCALMADEIYKVGWTSGTASERADELSKATGVPSAFIVVDAWKHADPRGLEKNVHALLDPYRVNDRREFFRLPYAPLSQIIEREIDRLSRARTDVR